MLNLMDTQPDLAAHVRELREQLNLTQAQLAALIDLYPPFSNMRPGKFRHETISRYENGILPVTKWYLDTLNYLVKHPLKPGETVDVTFQTVITKRNPRMKEKIEW